MFYITISKYKKMTKCKDCDRQASFGYKGGQRMFCKEHRDDDMISISGKVCVFSSCPRRASFGYTKTDKELYCVLHQKVNMINVVSPTCEEPGV